MYNYGLMLVKYWFNESLIIDIVLYITYVPFYKPITFVTFSMDNFMKIVSESKYNFMFTTSIHLKIL